MPQPNETRGPTMQDPATYRIAVRGRLDPKWSSRLAGMTISHRRWPGGGVATVLEGRLADQAALSGVLNALYELHLPVLSADCLDRELPPPNGGDRSPNGSADIRPGHYDKE